MFYLEVDSEGYEVLTGRDSQCTVVLLEIKYVNQAYEDFRQGNCWNSCNGIQTHDFLNVFCTVTQVFLSLILWFPGTAVAIVKYSIRVWAMLLITQEL